MGDPIIATLPDGTELEFPDGTPDAVVDAAVKRHLASAPIKDGVGQGDVKNFTPAAAPDPDAVQPNSPQDWLERGSRAVFGEAAPMVNRAAITAMQGSPLGLLPTVLEGGAPAGGMIGGTLGGLSTRSYAGGNVGAATGGAIGGGLKQWFRTGQAPTAPDVTTDAITQGALQAILPGVGKVFEKAALPIYKAALRPGALAREFDVDIAARGLKERLPVDVPASIAKAAERTTASRQQALAMGRATEDPNNLIQSREVLGGLRPVFKKARTQEALGEGPGALAGLASRVRRIAQEAGGTPGKPGGFTNVRAQELKEEAQDLGANALKAKALGHPINEVDALGKMEVAAGFQRGLETRTPGLKEQNLNTKELLALLKALEVSEGRQLGGTGSGNVVADVMAGATGLAATGGNPMGATAGLAAARLLRGLGSNQSMSKGAILLDRTGKGLGGDRLTNAVRLLRMKIADVDEQNARERERE
jgi:hypothetical protein